MPRKGTRTSAIDRFITKVHIPQDSSQCWIWQGARRRHGHGAFAPDGSVPRSIHAHRWIYQHVNGVHLPPDVFVCHRCDNPPCVNPAHLYAGSRADNVRDMVQRDRQARGSGVATARLQEADVRAIRSSRQTQKFLAQKYRVNRSTIQDIQHRRTWRHIPG
jgi:hypothetical protein